MKKVPSLPAEFCVGCMLNGCYPWNSIPLITCGWVSGGWIPTPWLMDGDVARQCLEYKPVSDETWMSYMKGLKEEAAREEESRLQVTQGVEVYSNSS